MDLSHYIAVGSSDSIYSDVGEVCEQTYGVANGSCICSTELCIFPCATRTGKEQQ